MSLSSRIASAILACVLSAAVTMAGDNGATARDRYLLVATGYTSAAFARYPGLDDLAASILTFQTNDSFYLFEAKMGAMEQMMKRYGKREQDQIMVLAVLEGSNPNMKYADAYQYILNYIDLFLDKHPILGSLAPESLRVLLRQVTRPSEGDRSAVDAAVKQIGEVIGDTKPEFLQAKEDSQTVWKLFAEKRIQSAPAHKELPPPVKCASVKCENLRKEIYMMASYTILHPILRAKAKLGIEMMMSNAAFYNSKADELENAIKYASPGEQEKIHLVTFVLLHLETETQLQTLHNALAVGIPSRGNFARELRKALYTHSGAGDTDPATYLARKLILETEVKKDMKISRKKKTQLLQKVVEKIKVEIPEEAGHSSSANIEPEPAPVPAVTLEALVASTPRPRTRGETPEPESRAIEHHDPVEKPLAPTTLTLTEQARKQYPLCKHGFALSESNPED